MHDHQLTEQQLLSPSCCNPKILPHAVCPKSRPLQGPPHLAGSSHLGFRACFAQPAVYRHGPQHDGWCWLQAAVLVPALLSTEELGALAKPRALHHLRDTRGRPQAHFATGCIPCVYTQPVACRNTSCDSCSAAPTMAAVGTCEGKYAASVLLPVYNHMVHNR